MNQKELNELRRRFRLDKNNFSRVYGCYVNSNKEIIAWVDTSMGLMRQEEQEMYLGLLKKSLSGTLGKNLIDVVFSTQQVADSDEHRLLQSSRTPPRAKRSAAKSSTASTWARQTISSSSPPMPTTCRTAARMTRFRPTRRVRSSSTLSAPSALSRPRHSNCATTLTRASFTQAPPATSRPRPSSASSTPRSTTARRTFTMCCSTRKTPRRSIRRSSTRCSTSTRRCLPRSRKTPLARRLPARSTRIAATMSSSPCTSRSERASKITRRAKTPSRLK